jgi:hypothetical protein
VPCRPSNSASRIISALPFCISAFAIAMEYICGAAIYQGGTGPRGKLAGVTGLFLEPVQQDAVPYALPDPPCWRSETP